MIKRNLLSVASFGGLFVCLLVFSIVPPFFGENIWTAQRMSTLVSDVIVLAIMAVGAVFVYALGHMDISIGKQLGLYATLYVWIGNQTGSLWLGIGIALICAFVIATINGVAGQLLNIHPIISSLVFMMVLAGVNTIIYNQIGSRNISLVDVSYDMFRRTEFMLLVLFIEVILVSYLFYFTRVGKNVRAIGANGIAAEQSGIHLLRYKVISYWVMGISVVIAAMFQMGYTGSASESTGTGFEMHVLIAMILGGMPLSGGMRARVSAALVGAITYSLLNIGLPLIGIKPNEVFLIRALIFLAVVLVTCRKRDGILPR